MWSSSRRLNTRAMRPKSAYTIIGMNAVYSLMSHRKPGDGRVGHCFGSTTADAVRPATTS